MGSLLAIGKLVDGPDARPTELAATRRTISIFSRRLGFVVGGHDEDVHSSSGSPGGGFFAG